MGLLLEVVIFYFDNNHFACDGYIMHAVEDQYAIPLPNSKYLKGRQRAAATVTEGLK